MTIRPTQTIASALLALGIFTLGTATSSASLLAYFGDGTAADAAALNNLAPAGTGYTVSTLDNVGFEGGTSITRTEFGSGGNTPAGPTAGSAAASEWFFQRANQVGGTPGTTTDYYGFTVTANPNYTLDLNSLKFDFTAVANTVGGINALAQTFISVDGGSFTAIGPAVAASAATGAGFSPVSSGNIDLSAITGATSVGIRIGIGDNSGVNSKASWIQGIQFDANAVPEPSTAFALGLGAFSLLFGRRKRRISFRA